MSKDHHIIIVKKKSKGHHDEHHGGAWKVAFADFAVAMMAFFMVLWLMGITTQEERMEIEQRLQTATVFDNIFEITNSPFPIDFDGNMSPFEKPMSELSSGEERFGSSMFNKSSQGSEKGGRNRKLNSAIAGKHLSTPQLSVLAKAISQIAEELSASENIVLEIVPQGLRILIQDDDEHFMYERGSVELTPFFEDMLFNIAPILGQIKNRMVISGHTDSTRFKRQDYSNWDLSGARALKARQVLVDSGLSTNNVLQVVAMAERTPVYKQDTRSGKNRRIEMMVLTKEADDQLALLFGKGQIDESEGTAVKNARSFAEANRPVSRLDMLVN
ncbi:Flagellar motor rotation protein MotB [Photobacterium marinum]|uniref:Flagellar motor rotation protein MotB n=1 Tax=Photobacterium marinum TaxID=1056511 RepID=L8JE07_9GAMM|nr:flagellar motor protein MotB [Photobacterium marinum]ELR67091.1 Flagellar motor rotation protein MotB [Photobacterium marinum]